MPPGSLTEIGFVAVLTFEHFALIFRKVPEAPESRTAELSKIRLDEVFEVGISVVL